MISTREQIPEILDSQNIGCELGVFEGEYSKILIDSNKFNKLYLVDVFSGHTSNFGKVCADASVLEFKVKDRFKNDERVAVIKQDSVSFLKSIPDNFFDFVYIDTIHSYEQATQELKESYRVVKKGGWICGHDYCKEFYGVIKAVNEFCQQFNLDVIITTDHPYPSFIINLIK